MMFSSFGCSGKEALLEFLDYVNSYHETIKYTWEWSKEKLSYMDVLVSIKDNRTSSDVYLNQRTYISIWTVNHAIRVMLRKEFLMGRH